MIQSMIQDYDEVVLELGINVIACSTTLFFYRRVAGFQCGKTLLVRLFLLSCGFILIVESRDEYHGM